MAVPDFSPHFPTVLLVAEDDAAWDILREAEATLAAFDVNSRRQENGAGRETVGPPDPGNDPPVAIIVASADGELPGRWAATGILTLRVPAAGRGKTPVALLQDEENALPSGPLGGEFGTMAIGMAGARNAALFVVATVALRDPLLRERWRTFRERQTAAVLAGPVLSLTEEEA